MASTYSALKIELIGTGDQAGTWGATTNTNLGTAIEEAITGSANVTFASANVALALTDTNATQTARNLRLNLVGTIAAQQHLFVPAIEKQYLVSNTLTFPVVIANGSNSGATGTTFTLPAGRSSLVFNDGTNINDVVTFVTSLGNVSLSNVTINQGTSNGVVHSNVSIISGNINSVTSNASTFSNVSIISGNINNITSNASTFSNATLNSAQINAYTEGITTGYTNTGNAYTINIATSTIVTANLTANCTFTMPSNTAGKSFILFLKTGAGNYTGTFTGVKFVGNTAPTITTTANRMDILTFTADGQNWYGNYAQGYNPN
jgi:hypothetical protein